MNRHNQLEENFGHRVAIFIDVRNIYKAIIRYKNSKINFSKFLEWCAGNCSVTSAIAYVMLSDTPEKESKFYDALRLNGYDIKTKKIYYGTDEKSGNKYALNSWSLGISLDISLYCNRVDTVIIVSNDKDFIETCYFYRNKVRIEVISIREATDIVLIKAATEFTDIPEDCLNIVEYKEDE